MKTKLGLWIILFIAASASEAAWEYDINFSGDLYSSGSVTFLADSGTCSDLGCTSRPEIDFMVGSDLLANDFSFNLGAFTDVTWDDIESELVWSIDPLTDELISLEFNSAASGAAYPGIVWFSVMDGALDRGVWLEELSCNPADCDPYEGENYIRATGAFTADYVLPNQVILTSFDDQGTWAFQDAAWTQVSNNAAQLMAVGDFDGDGEQDIVVSFGADGLWIRWNNGDWEQLHTLPADQISVGDMDNNGLDDIIISFNNGHGIYIWMNNSTWDKLHDQPARGITM